MKRAFAKTPRLVRWLFHKRVWAFSRSNNKVYLSFDDGPIPQVTPWVLEQLKKHQAKATFFCIGDNINKYPEIFNKVINEGHTVGNHTQHHVSGWNSSTTKYLKEIKLCEDIINSKKTPPFPSKKVSLFRPPYGKMTSKQTSEVLKQGYSVIMWDILSKDYNQEISQENCLNNVLQNINKGSIVVFHDSLKAEKNLRYVLPKVLEHLNQKGWECCRIPEE